MKLDSFCSHYMWNFVSNKRQAAEAAMLSAATTYNISS